MRLLAALLLSLTALGWADHDDDGNNGPDLLVCNYNKKPWKEMSQGQKKLNVLRLLKYDTLNNDVHEVHTAVVFMAPKSLQLDGVQFRSKFTKTSWYESAMDGEDRHAHIVKSSEYFSTADTVNHHLQKFDSAQSMENFGRGLWMQYNDDYGEYDDLFNDLPYYENDYTFYYTEGEHSPADFESFSKVRVELWRPDSDGNLRVDACHRMKWQGSPSSSAVVCEEPSRGQYDYPGRIDGQTTLACGTGRSIKITSGFYGRQYCDGLFCYSPDYSNCLPEYCSLGTCDCGSNNNVLTLLEGKCDGEQSCTVEASNGFVGFDPCPGDNKYLMVEFTCI